MFASMGPVVELREKDFDLLGVAELHRQITASEPLWPVFDVKFWQLSSLDDRSSVA
jgi:hypothetical protein